jgi:hypothetical protein
LRKKGKAAMQKESECPCTTADCERHGDCVACSRHHTPPEKAPFCMRPENAALFNELELKIRARLMAAGLLDGI